MCHSYKLNVKNSTEIEETKNLLYDQLIFNFPKSHNGVFVLQMKYSFFGLFNHSYIQINLIEVRQVTLGG